MSPNGTAAPTQQFPRTPPTANARLSAATAGGGMNRLTDRVPTTTIGFTGLSQLSGYITEERAAELSGVRGVRTYQMMGYDAIAGACLYALRSKIRQVQWRVLPSTHPKANATRSQAAADYIQSCMDDMERPWPRVLGDLLTALQYGWSYLEQTWKYRRGQSPDLRFRSLYDDNKPGWRRFSIRSQDTLYRWEYTPPHDPQNPNALAGLWQIAPPTFETNFIPLNKAVHFTIDEQKENPEGVSIFRSAYEAWYMRKTLQTVEAIGIERDLNGIPMAGVPPELLDPNAPPELTEQLNAIRNLVTLIKRDEQQGIVFPLAYDEQGHKIYELGLLNSEGHRQFDTSAVIGRYGRDMAMSMLMDVLYLGHERGGAANVADVKTDMLDASLTLICDNIADTWQRQAIAPLCMATNIAPEDTPYLHHGNVERANLAELADYILQLAQASAPLFPNPTLEDHLLDLAGLPVPTQDERAERQKADQADKDMQQELMQARLASGAGDPNNNSISAPPNPSGRNQRTGTGPRQTPLTGSPATTTRRPTPKATTPTAAPQNR